MSSWRALISPNEEKYFGAVQECDSGKKVQYQKKVNTKRAKAIQRGNIIYQMDAIKEKTQLRDLLQNFPRLREKLCKTPKPSSDDISTNLTTNISVEPLEALNNNSKMSKKNAGREDKESSIGNEKRNTTNKKIMKSLEEDILITTMKKKRDGAPLSNRAKKDEKGSPEMNINRFSCSLADSSKESIVEYVSKLSKRLKEEKAEREKLSSEFTNIVTMMNGFQNEINTIKENFPTAKKEGDQSRREFISHSQLNSPRDTGRLLQTSRSLNSPYSPINNYSFQNSESVAKRASKVFQNTGSKQTKEFNFESHGKGDISFSKVNHFKSRSQASEKQSEMFSPFKMLNSGSHMRIMSSIDNKLEDLSFEKSEVQTINSGRVSIDSILCGLVKINESGENLKNLDQLEEKVGRKLAFLKAQRKKFNDLMFEMKLESPPGKFF